MRNGAPHKLLQGAAGWAAVGVGFFAVVVITAITSSPAYGLGAGLLFVGLLAGSFASIVVHELGHAIAAWLVGWRVWIISALPVVLRIGHRPHFSTKFSHDVGGYVLGSPSRAALDRPWRSMVFSAGGPLASLLTGPLFIYWLTTLPRAGWETPTGAGLLGAGLAFGFYGAWAATMTSLPMRSASGRPNDGLMMLSAWSEPKAPDQARGVAWASALFENGVEPSAWPPWMREAVARAVQAPWVSRDAPLLAFVCALEEGDRAAARAAAQRDTRESGAILHAYVSAWFDNDANAAESLLAATKHETGVEAIPWLRARTETRIHELKGDTSAARRTGDALESAIRDSGAPQPFWERLLAERS